MEPVSHVIKVSLPNYLSNLPVPNSLGGWFKLGVRDWLSLIPFGAVIGGVTYLTYKAYCPRARDDKTNIINQNIKKDVKKVADSFDVEDIGEKASFCRCWKSKTFPYCDGAHGAHNKETGDNVGPVTIKRQKELAKDVGVKPLDNR